MHRRSCSCSSCSSYRRACSSRRRSKVAPAAAVPAAGNPLSSRTQAGSSRSTKPHCRRIGRSSSGLVMLLQGCCRARRRCCSSRISSSGQAMLPRNCRTCRSMWLQCKPLGTAQAPILSTHRCVFLTCSAFNPLPGILPAPIVINSIRMFRHCGQQNPSAWCTRFRLNARCHCPISHLL